MAAAMRLAGATYLNGNATVEENVRPRRGALVLYPVVESEPRIASDGSVDPRDLVMVFAFVAQCRRRPAAVRWCASAPSTRAGATLRSLIVTTRVREALGL
ncbi:hypothetical protein ACFRAO_10040 [Streptomyces sp. NPDC056656]|uniref:hypothetical protein n=1 Tax=Streptomyces sp. NPDC056656 TaxID=3345895 RepID=UPI0036B821CC